MTNFDFLKNIILQIPTEEESIEFKRVVGKASVSKVIETIVAMSNGNGGRIILGVGDPEKDEKRGLDRVYGIDEDFDNFDAIGREIIKIVPPLTSAWPPKIIDVPEIGKKIAIIVIPKSADSLKNVNNKVFIRQQKSNKELSPAEIIKLSYAKGFQKSDLEIVNVDFSLLNTEYYSEWKNERGLKGDIENILLKTGLAKKDKNKKIKPSRAAVLLFAEFPTDLMETKSAIKIFQYSGTLETVLKEGPNLLEKPKLINGPLIKCIKDTHREVLFLLRNGIKVESGFVNKYSIPERVVKEVITNAVIHRDYYVKRDIEIKIFEDRIEVDSPGLLPYNITTSNIGKERADGYRNDLIVKHLREFPEPPNLDANEGVVTMRAQMKKYNLYEPIFLTYPSLKDYVKVTLFNELIATEWDRVEDYLKKNKYINNETARGVAGIKQRDKMTKLLKKWVSQGLLMQIVPKNGFVKGTKYKLTASEISL